MSKKEISNMNEASRVEVADKINPNSSPNSASKPELMAYIEAMLKEELKPPNSIIEYFIKQMQIRRNVFDEIAPQIQKLEESLQQARMLADKANVEFVNYQNDIAHWLEKEKENKDVE